jgi:hypothetical protein
MNEKLPECWASDPQARAIKVEPTSGQSIILPYPHFAYAEATVDGPDQVLKLVFATHEVVVRGRALRRVEAAVHRLELSWVAPLPDRVRGTVPDGQPFIREVSIIAVAGTENESGSTNDTGAQNRSVKGSNAQSNVKPVSVKNAD